MTGKNWNDGFNIKSNVCKAFTISMIIIKKHRLKTGGNYFKFVFYSSTVP